MKAKLFGLVILLIGLMFGCELSNSDDIAGEKSGKVIIKLTDAPFPSDKVDSVLVTIDWIKLKKEGEESDDESSEEETTSSFTMIEVDTTVNLLELSNGISMVLGELESVPVGEYSEIRMHVTEAKVYVNHENEAMDIKIPSGSSSGLKIKIKPALVVGGFGPDETVLIDFDVSRSFLVKGNPKGDDPITGFKFKPVIRAVPEAYTGEVFGMVKDTLAGTPSDPVALEGAQLHLIYEGESSPDTISALTDVDGMYRIIGVPKGDYLLSCGKVSHDTLTQVISILNHGDEVQADEFILTKQ